MLAATVIAGLCFRKMILSALAICYTSFYRSFIDPRSVTFHRVSEKKIASIQRAGVGEMQLVIDVRSCQCHQTLKHSQFLLTSQFLQKKPVPQFSF